MLSMSKFCHCDYYCYWYCCWHYCCNNCHQNYCHKATADTYKYQETIPPPDTIPRLPAMYTIYIYFTICFLCIWNTVSRILTQYSNFFMLQNTLNTYRTCALPKLLTSRSLAPFVISKDIMASNCRKLYTSRIQVGYKLQVYTHTKLYTIYSLQRYLHIHNRTTAPAQILAQTQSHHCTCTIAPLHLHNRTTAPAQSHHCTCTIAPLHLHDRTSAPAQSHLCTASLYTSTALPR